MFRSVGWMGLSKGGVRSLFSVFSWTMGTCLPHLQCITGSCPRRNKAWIRNTNGAIRSYRQIAYNTFNTTVPMHDGRWMPWQTSHAPSRYFAASLRAHATGMHACSLRVAIPYFISGHTKVSWETWSHEKWQVNEQSHHPVYPDLISPLRRQWCEIPAPQHHSPPSIRKNLSTMQTCQPKSMVYDPGQEPTRSTAHFVRDPPIISLQPSWPKKRSRTTPRRQTTPCFQWKMIYFVVQVGHLCGVVHLVV